MKLYPYSVQQTINYCSVWREVRLALISRNYMYPSEIDERARWAIKAELDGFSQYFSGTRKTTRLRRAGGGERHVARERGSNAMAKIVYVVSERRARWLNLFYWGQDGRTAFHSAAIAKYRWAAGRNNVMRIGLQQLITVFLQNPKGKHLKKVIQFYLLIWQVVVGNIDIYDSWRW